jgi:2-C-methyl-D-erythritol 4-phosphate cytidylyltransferase
MRHIGIIVAAGKGTRFGGDLPKQFTEVGGHPLLFYSLKAMQESFLDEIIVVTGEDWVDFTERELVEKFSFSKVSRVIRGGKERSDSV